jgi:hypothetical protein
MLFTPSANEYQWFLPTHNGRPASGMGATLIPGVSNTKGSYSELIDGANVTNDVWWIAININSGNISSAARDMLIDIAIDPTAGTSYSVVIPDLLAPSPRGYGPLGSGMWYQFPLFIPAGSSIAARAAVNNANAGLVRVQAFLYGKPRNPESTRVGNIVEAIGINAGSSSGTAVTSGTTSEGGWTALGSPTRDCWFFQLGFGLNQGGIASSLSYHGEIGSGNGSNKRIIVPDVYTAVGVDESVVMLPHMGVASVHEGDTLYGRLQCSGTLVAGTSMAAYCLS